MIGAAAATTIICTAAAAINILHHIADIICAGTAATSITSPPSSCAFWSMSGSYQVVTLAWRISASSQVCALFLRFFWFFLYALNESLNNAC
jgi:hypothetical protein